jgi:hypothetical protein
MPTAQSHLFRRGAVYYFRRRLPAWLAAAAGQSHVGLSLKIGRRLGFIREHSY